MVLRPNPMGCSSHSMGGGVSMEVSDGWNVGLVKDFDRRGERKDKGRGERVESGVGFPSCDMGRFSGPFVVALVSDN